MKKLLIIILFLSLVIIGFSQDGANDPQGGRIEALKIAYLTKKLNLSPGEAQKFWPIYNNYAAEIKDARIEQRQNKISELDAEDKVLNIRKKFNSEFTKALDKDKINTFFRSEKDFGNFIQKELTERRQLRQDLKEQRNSR
ncbi:MAG: hypothetical protein ABI415_03175 [Flavitalea sp.]